MGRAAGVARRRKKTANLRKKSRKTLKRVRTKQLKKSGGIACEEIREEWNMQRSMRTNMAKMGLSHDPNYSMAKATRQSQQKKLLSALEEYTKQKPKGIVDKVQEKLLKQQQKKLKAKKNKEFDVSEMNNDNNNGDNNSEEDNDFETTQNETKTKVIEALEKKAAKPPPKNFRFGPESIAFCVYMIEKYDDDYEAMSRDKCNYYQESAGQIKAKIKKFVKFHLEKDQEE